MKDWSRENTTILAYVGDAVYELHVREHVVSKDIIKANILHKSAVKYVRAHAQAEGLRLLIPELTEIEADLVRRARNKKISSKPKNADPIDYKLATAFEALIGYLHLMEETDRLEYIIDKMLENIEEMKK